MPTRFSFRFYLICHSLLFKFTVHFESSAHNNSYLFQFIILEPKDAQQILSCYTLPQCHPTFILILRRVISHLCASTTWFMTFWPWHQLSNTKLKNIPTFAEWYRQAWMTFTLLKKQTARSGKWHIFEEFIKHYMRRNLHTSRTTTDSWW